MGEERGDGGLARLGRRGGENHIERDEMNPTVATTQTERHGRRCNPTRTSIGGGGFFSKIRRDGNGIEASGLGLWERTTMQRKGHRR